MRIERALITVYNKEGLEEFASFLNSLSVEILSTGGTGEYLRSRGLNFTPLSRITGFDEMVSGRVKTLHPALLAGILMRRGVREEREELERAGGIPIDMVVVDLYPFEEALTGGGGDPHDPGRMLELIDIGGVTLLRAGAKNFNEVTVVPDRREWGVVMEDMKENSGAVSFELRAKLAERTFKIVSRYDSIISLYLEESFSGVFGRDLLEEEISLPLRKVLDLRYGENPHQHSALYIEPHLDRNGVRFRQHQGRELSYTNILDFESGLRVVGEFDEPAAAIIKHTNPCGVARGDDLLAAFDDALGADPLSAFGGIACLNGDVDEDLARRILERFFEGVIAPRFSQESLAVLGQRRRLRLLSVGGLCGKSPHLETRGTTFGLLVQTGDVDPVGEEVWRPVTKRVATPEERRGLLFAMKVCRHVKSNAIVISTGDKTLGIGAGQMSRVDSVRLAIDKIASPPGEGEVMVLASDAFFPFPDSIELARRAGVTAIIQPGGSIKDEEIIDAANRAEMAMLFTGRRHFKH